MVEARPYLGRDEWLPAIGRPGVRLV